jgi:hypothetical protein
MKEMLFGKRFGFRSYCNDKYRDNWQPFRSCTTGRSPACSWGDPGRTYESTDDDENDAPSWPAHERGHKGVSE